MASDTVKDIIDKIRREWKKAASRSLPKNAWLRELAGRHYSAVSKSKAWKEISKQYDDLIDDKVENSPRQVLFREIDAIKERQADPSYRLDQADLAVCGMLINIYRTKLYRQTQATKDKREARKTDAEINLIEARTALINKELNDKDSMIEDDITLDGFTDSEIADIKGTAGNEEATQEL